LEEEPGSSKPISYIYIWVLYGLNTGFVRFKYGFCTDEAHLFWAKTGFFLKIEEKHRKTGFLKKTYKFLGF